MDLLWFLYPPTLTNNLAQNGKNLFSPYTLPNAKTTHTTSKTEPMPLVCELKIRKTADLALGKAWGRKEGRKGGEGEGR